MKVIAAVLALVFPTQALAQDISGSYFCYTSRDMMPYNGDLYMNIENVGGYLRVVINDTERLEVMRCNARVEETIKCDDTHSVTYNAKRNVYYRTYRENGSVKFMEFGLCRRNAG